MFSFKVFLNLVSSNAHYKQNCYWSVTLQCPWTGTRGEEKGRMIRTVGETEKSSDVSSKNRGNGRVSTDIMENINLSLAQDMVPIQYYAGFLLLFN
jgi:hypothetical protein